MSSPAAALPHGRGRDLEGAVDTTPTRVLVVADWEADPDAVIAACRERAGAGPVVFGLLVPAMLHGLDWVGDPYASRPCAARRLEQLQRLAAAAGLPVQLAALGDPDPASAVGDALSAFAAAEVLVCGRPHRHGPLTLAHRLRRTTGLPVASAAVPVARSPRRIAVLGGSGHCTSRAA
jgi:hypothetical protein